METATNRELEEGVVLPFDGRRPLLDHLEELRWRFLRSFLWIGLGMIAAWRAAPHLLQVLIRPVGQVVFLSPAEPFMVHLKVAFLGGLGLSFPLLAWEAWSFVRPAFPGGSRWPVLALIPVSAGLFFAGAWFGWKLLLPAALKILLSFGGVMTPMITVGSYISFAGWLIAGCGLIFQVPLVVLFLAAVGLVRPAMLLRQWRLAVIGILIIAAVITPTPDIFTQLLLAGPLAVLYLLSVVLSFLVPKVNQGAHA